MEGVPKLSCSHTKDGNKGFWDTFYQCGLIFFLQKQPCGNLFRNRIVLDGCDQGEAKIHD